MKPHDDFICFQSVVALSVILLMTGLSCVSCSGASSQEDLAGRKYKGYYHPAQRIAIRFETDSTVQAVISSTEFVGHFFDDISGRYSFDYPTVDIFWEEADKRNDVYKTVPPPPDSVRVTASLDSLLLYENGEMYVLEPYHRLELFKSGHDHEAFGGIVAVLILLASYLFIILRFIIVLAVFFAILYLIIKWLRKRSIK